MSELLMSSTECCNKIKVLLQQNTSFSMWKFLESGHLFIFSLIFPLENFSLFFNGFVYVVVQIKSGKSSDMIAFGVIYIYITRPGILTGCVYVKSAVRVCPFASI